MTAPATPPDTPRTGLLFAGLSLAAVLLGAAAVILTGGGCSKPPPPPADSASGPRGDPWVAAAAKLKKETDLAATRSALTGLTNDVSIHEGEKLPAMTDEALNALAALVPLSQADREEIRGAAFSAHDPVYLADCFYLRDAARSLALTGLPPEKQADLAFAWVCRQVYLQPWLRPLGTDPRGNQLFDPVALPPTAVLRRGFGSGLERMYVFLALLQQLELDGCLVGMPEAGNAQFRLLGPKVKYPHAADLGVPRGPFWAAGVRVGNDVRLFDPWRGQPFPVTLNNLKANPEAAKAWFEDKANISGTTLDDAKKVTVFLAVPVNALSARMAMFEAKLKGELGVKLAYDAKALTAMRAAYPDPKPAFWNPVDDAFAYGRAARSYLPLDMGGSDTTRKEEVRLYEASLHEQIPASAFATPRELRSGAARDRFRAIAAGGLAMAFIEPPSPRERIQRGQFQDAARDLVKKQEQFTNGLERLRNTRPEQVSEWVEEANQLYQELGRTQLPGNMDKVAEAQAQAQIESHWKQAGAQVIVDKASAEVGRAEASLLLGLCKHEQAERLQTRLERASGPEADRLKSEAFDAWRAALSAWRTYQTVKGAHAGFPGRSAHAGELAARAAKFAAPEKK